MIDDVAAYIAFRTVYDFLLAQFDALAFGWLSRMLTWVHGIASGLLTLHLAWQGYQLITGNVSASAAARLTDTWRAVVRSEVAEIFGDREFSSVGREKGNLSYREYYEREYEKRKNR